MASKNSCCASSFTVYPLLAASANNNQGGRAHNLETDTKVSCNLLLFMVCLSAPKWSLTGGWPRWSRASPPERLCGLREKGDVKKAPRIMAEVERMVDSGSDTQEPRKT